MKGEGEQDLIINKYDIRRDERYVDIEIYTWREIEKYLFKMEYLLCNLSVHNPIDFQQGQRTLFR